MPQPITEQLRLGVRKLFVGVDRRGYGHRHLGLYIQQAIDAELLEPLVATHVENCPIATWEAHGAGTTVVEHSPSQKESTGLVGYLGYDVPGMDTCDDRSAGVLHEPEHRVRGATMLDAGGWQAVRLPRSI